MSHAHTQVEMEQIEGLPKSPSSNQSSTRRTIGSPRLAEKTTILTQYNDEGRNASGNNHHIWDFTISQTNDTTTNDNNTNDTVTTTVVFLLKIISFFFSHFCALIWSHFCVFILFSLIFFNF